MIKRKSIPESTKRAIFMRSHGRCEYLNCGKVVASVENDFRIRVTGEFAHIIPVGDGPRSEFRKSGTDPNKIELDQPHNVLLLCREHHRKIDHEQVKESTPAVLFAMVSRRYERLEEGITTFFLNNPFGFDCKEMAEDLRIGRIVTLLNRFNLDGPSAGRKHLQDARRLLLEIERNPHIHLPVETIALIDLAISARFASAPLTSECFLNELKYAKRRFCNVNKAGNLVIATLQMMVFVRDENEIMDGLQHLSIIRDLLSPIDRAIKEISDDAVEAALLGIKSALVRWRARVEIKNARANSLMEAKRCASASLKLRWSCHGWLQLALSDYALASSLSKDRRAEYNKKIELVDEALCDKRLDDYPAAIKYRPRYFRETHRWEEALRSFWLAADIGLEGDMQSIAYIAGEAAASYFAYEKSGHDAIDKANSFLAESIGSGFDSGRNMIAWVFTRALLDPSWFRQEFVERIRGEDGKANLDAILKDISRRYLSTECGRQDVLFGVSDVEFWNSVARTIQVALGDHEMALRFYGIAERYSRRVAGNFVTRMGMARSALALGLISDAKARCGMAANVALASQIGFVHSLQEQILLVEQKMGNVRP
ncbi:HNH endonuclease signature motif containing protein [Hoeflea olei]|uniref:HNH endonuclease signature motif containing protein n=1 Tax=Hoeflea olei TaxID=1480615 RepID=UPI001112A32B|nr:HNH endonuclease signature motif containing protein [Hoeflea olei]